MALRPSDERRLQEVAEGLAEAQQARDDAIVAAYENGGSLKQIALAVGMSHQGVSKLLERLGVRKRWETVEDAREELTWRDQRDRIARRDPPATD